MTKEGADFYAVLEFQGLVDSVPRYDKASGWLWFNAQAPGRSSLGFAMHGALAKAMKNCLSVGTAIQMQCVPRQFLCEIEGRKFARVVWVSAKCSVLGRRKKKNLADFTSKAILDDLMPLDDEFDDIGFVNPNFETYIIRRKKIKERADKAVEERADDPSV